MNATTAMAEKQIKNLNGQFDAFLERGISPYAAMACIAGDNSLEIIREDDDHALLRSRYGLVNCWFDDVSKFGFDDQTDHWFD